jgi:hypothetical protein
MTTDPAQLSRLARDAHRALVESKGGSLMRASLARKLRVGRRKAWSWRELDAALDELVDTKLATTDNYDRYTIATRLP